MIKLSDKQIQKLKMVLASKDLFEYCRIVDSKDFYDEKTAPYLKEICDAIQEFENDDNEALLILMPPRHGKTRTVNNSVNWLLGRNPRYKIMEGCYNVQLSRRSSKIVRDKIQQKKESGKIVFHQVFPNVTIKDGSGSVDNWGVTGSEEDNYLATAPNAGSTGIGCDFLILDDTIKNKYEAYNKEGLRKIWEDWFKDTLYSRLEGKRKIIVVMTRWSTKDIAGQLIQLLTEQGRKFKVIKKKAYDPETGKMLNDTILNKQAYDNLIKTVGEDIVKANYDQEPVDIKGKLYPHFLTYNSADIRSTANPEGIVQFKEVKAVADTADEGTDYLCMLIYGVTADKKIYVLDIYYTQDHMEITEKEAANRLTRFEPYIFRVESNNGGRGWSRNVETNYKNLGGTRTIFKPYTQTLNKEARILSNATEVMNYVYFPNDWHQRFREYYDSMNEYQRQGNNEHDDAEDATTAMVEDVLHGMKIRYA